MVIGNGARHWRPCQLRCGAIDPARSPAQLALRDHLFPQEDAIHTLRHLLSVMLLPFVVVVVLPRWILRSWVTRDVRLADTSLAAVADAAGLLIFAAGFGLFAWCLVLFARVGQGTLAPWDPTRRLVAVGPYRYVRNPMISGVAAMLVGEALFFGSALLAGSTALFVLINHIYFLVSEEPGLERRFGAAYSEYKQQVPRWLPRPGKNRDESAGTSPGG